MLLLCCWPSKKAPAALPPYPASQQSAPTPIMRIINKIVDRFSAPRAERQLSQCTLSDSKLFRRFICEFDDWFMIEEKQAPSRRALECRLRILGWTYDIIMPNQTDPRYSDHIKETRDLYFAVIARANKVLETEPQSA